MKYYSTRKVCRIGRACAVHLDKWWGFKKGDIVEIRIIDPSDDVPYFIATKRVCITGNSTSVFLDKAWGYEGGEIVTIQVQKCDHSGSSGQDDDS